MDYKEKLRLAKEALSSGSYDKETIEYIFSELKESDDEKIGNAILAAIRQGLDTERVLENSGVSYEDIETWLKEKTLKSSYEDEEVRKQIKAFVKSRGSMITKSKQESWIAWLEKQKQEELPHVHGRSTLEDYAYQVAYDLSNDWARETPTWKDVQVACKLGAKWQEEHKPVELSEEKHELMKKCVNKAYNQGYETGFEMCRQEMTHGNEWSEEKKHLWDFVVAGLDSYYRLRKNNGEPIPKELEEAITFIHSLTPQDLKEKVVEWSEEDEKTVSGLLSIVEDWYNSQSQEERAYYGDCGYINWLKSLHPNNIENKLEIARGEGYKQGKRDGLKEAIETADETCWKPSDEQIEALSRMVNFAHFDDQNRRDLVRTLYNDLRQLKGE